MIIDRRKHPRVDTEITPGEFFTIKVNEVFKKICDIKNLSAGGCAVETDNNIKVGDEIFVSFKLPGKVKFIDGLGKVVRTEGKVLGIQFLKMDFGDETKIKIFVKNELDEEGIPYYSANLSKI